MAEQVKVDHHTVSARRGELESTGEIPQLDKTTGKAGKEDAVGKRADKGTASTTWWSKHPDQLFNDVGCDLTALQCGMIQMTHFGAFDKLLVERLQGFRSDLARAAKRATRLGRELYALPAGQRSALRRKAAERERAEFRASIDKANAQAVGG